MLGERGSEAGSGEGEEGRHFVCCTEDVCGCGRLDGWMDGWMERLCLGEWLVQWVQLDQLGVNWARRTKYFRVLGKLFTGYNRWTH